MPISAKATSFTYGTAGANIITAEYLFGDLIDGLGGDDIITGLDGNDTLLGGTGRDKLYGMGGFDLLDGGAGADRLYGGSSDDVLRGDTGGIGNDFFDGGDDFDTVDYSTAPVTRGVVVNLSLTGVQDTRGAGKDTIINVEAVTGSTLGDTLTGTQFNNMLSGVGGNDTLNGLGGNDTLFGGAGNDRLLGGDGNDMLVGDQTGIGNDIIDGGLGIDIVEYYRSAATTGVRVDLNLTTAQNTVGAGTDTIINVEGIIGTVLGDTLIGNAGDNYLSGDNGADTISGGGGNDTLLGGFGNFADVLDGGAGNDRINGDQGVDTINGGTGNDLIRGGRDGDLLTGGEGADVFIFSGTTFTGDSPLANPDTIMDFAAEDQVVLQSFNWTANAAFIGATGFSATGRSEVQVVDDMGLQQIHIDYDGNGSSDMTIFALGAQMTAANFAFVTTYEF